MYNHFRLFVEHCLHVSLLGSLISLILYLNLTTATAKRLRALYPRVLVVCETACFTASLAAIILEDGITFDKCPLIRVRQHRIGF